MGCDGGSIPKRQELVKNKKKIEKKDKEAEIASKWKYCAISSEKLRKPIVACGLGRLYNKEAVIQHLLNKEEMNPVASHIRSLKDVTELCLTEKTDYKESKNGENSDDSRFICPVVGLEMSGKYRFCFFQTCGCVISERALKEVKSDTCHKCGKSVDQDTDAIVLNGTEEEIDVLSKKLQETKNKKKKSKKRKHEEETEDKNLSHEQPSTSKSKSGNGSKTIVKGVSSFMLTDKAKKDYSVAKDSEASETYKSLFTSHESAKNKPKNNWVTFNPHY